MEKKQKNMNNGLRVLLHLVQQTAITGAAVLIVFLVMGSRVRIEFEDGIRWFDVRQEAPGTLYEDSRLFNEILGANISEIISFGAIRGQMETDGVYNGRKEIDVTAFANRYYGIPREYITAKYYLEDLLKWGQQGFEYKEGWLPPAEADKFLNPTNSVTKVNINDPHADNATITYLNTDLEDITYVYDVSGNILQPTQPNESISSETTALNPEDAGLLEQTDESNENTGPAAETDERENIHVTLLTNLYQSVDKKNIEKYVASWDEYYKLSDNLKKAASDLLTNFSLYEQYGNRFHPDSTNIRYCIRKTIGNQTEVYTNLDLQEQSLEQIETVFYDQCDKYIYYNPAETEYDTNTMISEETLRYIVEGYQYAYPEDTQIWIGINTTYPIPDAFYQGQGGYTGYVPYYTQMSGAAIGGLILYLLLLVILTGTAGRAQDAEGNRYIRLNRADKLPVEIMLLLTAAGAAAVVGGVIFCNDVLLLWLGITANDFIYSNWFIPACGMLVLLASLLFSYLYYGMVKRIKARSIWRDSLIRHLLSAMKRWSYYAYDNANLLLRVAVPIAVLSVVHIIFLIILAETGDETSWYLIGLLLAAIDVGLGALLYRSAKAREIIVAGIKKIKNGDFKHKIAEEKLHGDNLVLAQAVNSIGNGINNAVETSMKDERMKADLITNVSHDIKTPLTSIINYIDLIRRENITNDKIKEYVEVLDTKSQRLKQLTDDLVEASKISSGNLSLNWEEINLVELVNQTVGEFSEKFEQRGLDVKIRTGNNQLTVSADSRRIWRVMENLFNNVCKYALQNTRVYVDIRKTDEKQVELSVKNISEQPLNVNADELTERFIRGDVSRSTEGSGLGLSIAKSLTELQNGSFEISMDGDLFKVILTFPLLTKK